MSGVEADDVDIHHLTAVVETELEPIVISKVSGQCLEASTIVAIVEMTISYLSNGVAGCVGLPVDIGSFNDPAVV